MNINRGDIYLIDLTPNGNVQGNLRPCIVVSNAMCNKYSPILTVVALTSQTKKRMPTHVLVSEESGLRCSSIALCEQIFTVNRTELIKLVGYCTDEVMVKIDGALRIQQELTESFDYDRAFNLLNAINDADRFIKKHKEYPKEISFRNALVDEFKYYCHRHGKDCKEIIGEYKESITNSRIMAVAAVVNY